MSENYIVINGKRAELTEEQLKQLGIEVPKVNPFEQAKYNQVFYTIFGNGDVTAHTEGQRLSMSDYFNVANYCTDQWKTITHLKGKLQHHYRNPRQIKNQNQKKNK